LSGPSHHLPDGGFRNPWPEASGDEAIRRRFREIAWEWIRSRLPPDPEPGRLPVVASELANPTAGRGELRITWVGHATHLVQVPGVTLLTDPMWSERPSPLPWLGRKRFAPATPSIEGLPPVHGVLVTHDHYDHLDRWSVQALNDRFGSDITWYTPLGYRGWFASLGVVNIRELDWWDEHELPGGRFKLVAAPARHWTRRTPWGTNRRLWCSWAVIPGRAGTPADFRVYLGGDSAYASVFAEIGRRLGPFDASVLPIGAYEPRWFMRASHMNPEEAVQVWLDLGGRGAFLPSHWGTFRLTFEDPLEPPERLRAAWASRGLSERLLHVPRHGETVRIVRD